MTVAHDIPHADEAVSQVVYQTPPKRLAHGHHRETTAAPVAPSAPASPDTMASHGGQYHPWIARIGGRKFALVLVGMVCVMIISAGVMIYYTPAMADDQIRLIDTASKWIVAIVSLFVGGNAAKSVGQAVLHSRGGQDDPGPPLMSAGVLLALVGAVLVGASGGLAFALWAVVSRTYSATHTYSSNEAAAVATAA